MTAHCAHVQARLPAMSKLFLLSAFALTLPCSADHAEATQLTDGVPRRGVTTGKADTRDSLGGSSVARPHPAEMPAPSTLLPYGIGPKDAYTDIRVAIHTEARKRISRVKQRRGIVDWCLHRAYHSSRNGKYVDPFTGGKVHRRDMPYALKAWRRAVNRGWLRPKTCDFHTSAYALQLFTTGDIDMSYSYHMRYLVAPVPCYDPKIMWRKDVSAMLCLAKSKYACDAHPKEPCSKATIRKWWSR